MYTSRGHLFPLLLENDPARSVLDFEHSTNLTVRQLMSSEQAFVDLVRKTVALNEEEGTELVNVLLLDKIGDHEAVLRYLIKTQIREIE
jgi:hypothetical protein